MTNRSIKHTISSDAFAYQINWDPRNGRRFSLEDLTELIVHVDESTGEEISLDELGSSDAGPGTQGPPGPPGSDGLSAYEVAVGQGFVGNAAAWLASLVGPPGIGTQGPPGAPGSDGPPGVAGSDGPAGIQGIQGIQGPPGPSGSSGAGIFFLDL